MTRHVHRRLNPRIQSSERASISVARRRAPRARSLACVTSVAAHSLVAIAAAIDRLTECARRVSRLPPPAAGASRQSTLPAIEKRNSSSSIFCSRLQTVENKQLRNIQRLGCKNSLVGLFAAFLIVFRGLLTDASGPRNQTKKTKKNGRKAARRAVERRHLIAA